MKALIRDFSAASSSSGIYSDPKITYQPNRVLGSVRPQGDKHVVVFFFGHSLNIFGKETGGFLTHDALLFALCHELGHLYGTGDTPKVDGRDIAPEGQADYYAASKCAGAVFPKLPQWESKPDSEAVSPELLAAFRDRCGQAYPQSQEKRDLCERVSVAGYWFIRYLHWDFVSYGGMEDGAVPPEPSPLLNDPKIVKKTLDDYPSLQCRLDTVLAGALCNEPWNLDFHNGAGKCAESPGLGQRPACWFLKAPG